MDEGEEMREVDCVRMEEREERRGSCEAGREREQKSFQIAHLLII